MPRTPVTKELFHTKLANSYGGWIYCDQCSQTVGYLCYVAYDLFTLEYTCKCGGSGSISISFLKINEAMESPEPLISIKNRLCCQKDHSPLFTLRTNMLSRYKYEVVCNACNTLYKEENP